MIDSDEISKARAAIKHNRAALEASNECGCVYCLTIYESNGNFDWVDTDQPTDRWTALCQLCEEPFVIGDASGLSLVEGQSDLLNRLYEPLVQSKANDAQD